jgi:hypothetical protein
MKFTAVINLIVTLGHLDSVLKGGFRQSLLLGHVVGVFFSRVEVPSAHRSFFIALK